MEARPVRAGFDRSCHDEAAARGWELPAHDLHVLASPRNAIATVIPVWNEGARLRSQLAGLRPFLGITDIVIADADSSDGSTSIEELAESGVREKVTVHERGVSVALRAALAHSLLDGYDGVILMDGNGKDDPAMLATFARALGGGDDYAQGSRYLPGGKGVHTPLARDLLIRCVHSPLFSLAARRRFTDTTIGSRAFSRRFLMDPRVRPFRKEFRYYEIYFFLAWAACRLGYRVSEVPVTRTYPQTGAIPTKIQSPLAYWRMVDPLFRILLRRYRV